MPQQAAPQVKKDGKGTIILPFRDLEHHTFIQLK